MKSQKFDVILNRYSTLIIFLIPALTVFTLFVVLPIGEAAYYSFYRWNGYGDPEKFVGFKNYAYLFRNRVFIMSLKNNFYIIALSLFVQLPFALLVALMISDKIKGATFFRTIFFLPFILAEIVAGLIWAYIYDGNYGLVATIWGFFGIDPIFMVGDKDLALIAILIVIFWKYFGIHMMIYIAGLQAISKEVLEAAKVDGAGGEGASSVAAAVSSSLGVAEKPRSKTSLLGGAMGAGSKSLTGTMPGDFPDATCCESPSLPSACWLGVFSLLPEKCQTAKARPPTIKPTPIIDERSSRHFTIFMAAPQQASFGSIA